MTGGEQVAHEAKSKSQIGRRFGYVAKSGVTQMPTTWAAAGAASRLSGGKNIFRRA